MVIILVIFKMLPVLSIYWDITNAQPISGINLKINRSKIYLRLHYLLLSGTVSRI